MSFEDGLEPAVSSLLRDVASLFPHNDRHRPPHDAVVEPAPMQEARNKHEQPRDDDQLAALFTDEVRHRTAFSWPPLRVSHSRHSQPCRTNDDRPLRLAPSTKPKAYQVAATTDEAPPRLVYLVRHAEAGKTLGAVPGEDAFDRLTARGVGQAAELGALLHSREGCCAAVLSAGERRCQQTAAAIASALGVPAAEVRTDGALTCCLPGVSETPAQRAARGLRAVEAFLEATRGDVVVVSHGTLISLMLHSADLAADTTVRHRVCTDATATTKRGDSTNQNSRCLGQHGNTFHGPVLPPHRQMLYSEEPVATVVVATAQQAAAAGGRGGRRGADETALLSLVQVDSIHARTSRK